MVLVYAQEKMYLYFATHRQSGGWFWSK